MTGPLAAMTKGERVVFDSQQVKRRAVVREAEQALTKARAAVRGADMPTDLTPHGFYAMPVPERRRLLGLEFACVVVRRGRTGKEPLPERTRLIGRDEAPVDTTGLIAHVVGLHW